MHLFLKKIYRKNPFPKIYRINQCEVLSFFNSKVEILVNQLAARKNTFADCVTTTASLDIPKTISDAVATTITSTISIPDNGIITDVNLASLNITHSYTNDLIVTLSSPAGTSVILIDQPCGDDDNIAISLDDAAATATLPCPPTDNQTYRPANPLSAFNNESITGDWILSIEDVYGDDDGGSLNGWELELAYTCTEVCNNNIDDDGDGLIDCADSDCPTNCTSLGCADGVILLGSKTVNAIGSGNSGIPTINNFYIPAGNNRIVFVVANFEREHCQGGDNCTDSNSTGSGLGDNFASPNFLTGNPQLTARFTGISSIDKVNPLTLPDGDLRFMHQTGFPDPPGINSASFYSRESYFIALYESDINTILGGSAAGNINITLPDVTTPVDNADEAILMAYTFANIEQSPTGIVRSGVNSAENYTNNNSGGISGDFTMISSDLDNGQEPNQVEDGVFIIGFNGMENSGFSTISGFNEIDEVTVNNTNGNYSIFNEPDGFSMSAQFRNGPSSGIINNLTIQSSGAATPLSNGGMFAIFTLEACSNTPQTCPNFLTNEELDSGTTDWNVYTQPSNTAILSVDNSSQLSGTNSALVDITTATGTDWHVQFVQAGQSVEAGKNYTVNFQAKAAANRRISVMLQRSGTPYSVYWRREIDLSTTANTYSFDFIADSTNIGNVAFYCNLGESTENVWIDNLSYQEVCSPKTTCGTIQINNVTSSNCINHPLMDVATVDVEVSWSGAPFNDSIAVQIDNQTEFIAVNNGITSPHTIQFTIPANGSTNNNIQASWHKTTGCETSSTYNAPTACSADEIGCDILYICGDDKPYDGDAWDHGWLEYLDAINGNKVLTPVFSKDDASGMGLYDPNNTNTLLNINFNDYDLIIVSATTEDRLSTDLINSLAITPVSVLNSNINIYNDLGMTASEAGVVWQTNAFVDNTTSEIIYNFNNKINPWSSQVFLTGDYSANADVYLWEGAGDQVAGLEGVLFNYTSNDVLPSIASHGNRVFLGYHMNGFYGNDENGGTLPTPSSAWFEPAKHLTLVGKIYFDSALILASVNCATTPTTSCPLTNMYPGFPIDFLNDNTGWLDYNLGSDLELADNGNGTKTISGTITSGTPVNFGAGMNGTSCGANDGWTMSLILSDKMDWATFQAAGGSANVHANCNAQIATLDYWDVSGTLTGTGCNAGRTLTINGPQASYRLQIGYGGNNGDSACGFGMSTWFDMEENGTAINADIYAFLDETCYIDENCSVVNIAALDGSTNAITDFNNANVTIGDAIITIAPTTFSGTATIDEYGINDIHETGSYGLQLGVNSTGSANYLESIYNFSLPVENFNGRILDIDFSDAIRVYGKRNGTDVPFSVSNQGTCVNYDGSNTFNSTCFSNGDPTNSANYAFELTFSDAIDQIIFQSYDAGPNMGGSFTFIISPNISCSVEEPTLNKDVCYLIADGDGDGWMIPDTFYTFNHLTGAVTNIGLTGTMNIEAMALDTVNHIIYAADNDDFGVIDIATGAFTAINTDMGSLNGAEGSNNISDLDGMTYDYTNNIIWATERASEIDGLPDDLLLKIDPATGIPIADGFGIGVGYLTINTNENDLDDIAIATDGTLYAISNLGSSGNQRLGTINKITGVWTEIGDYGIEDVESLTFSAEGQLLATTGEDGDHQNSLYSIDANTAEATYVGSILPAQDVEACVCNFGNFIDLQIGDKVWADLDFDGIQDIEEPGIKNVTVNLLNENGTPYLDATNNPVTTITDIYGIYNFGGLSSGNYIVEFELPTGTSFSNKDIGGDDTKDSDADAVTGRTGVVTLSGSSNNRDADAGILNANVVVRDCDDAGELFVVDELGGAILRFNSTTGILIDTFITGLSTPKEMIVGADNYLYVSDAGLNEVRRYSLITGALIDVLARNLKAPNGMTFDTNGMLYVNNKSKDEVLKIDPSNGTIAVFVTEQLGGLDSNNGGLEFGLDGNLYVSSRTTDEVLRFNGTTGAFIDVFVSAGSGTLNGPDDIAFGADGRLYVVSSYSDQVKRYNGTTGAFIDDFITYRSGGLRGPKNLIFGTDSNIYVSGQTSPDGIYRYNELTGAFVDLFAIGLEEPRGMLFAPVPNCDITNCCSQINYANNSLENGTFSSFTSSSNPNGTATLTTFGGSDAIDWDPSGGYGTNGSPITNFGANPGYWIDASTNGGSGSLDGNRFYWLEPRNSAGGSDCLGAVSGADLLGTFCQGDTVEICGYVAAYDPNNINSGATNTDFVFEIYTNNGNDPADFITTPAGTSSVNDNGGNNESFTLPLPASTTILDIAGLPFTGANGQVADWRTLNWQSICFQVVLKEEQSSYSSIVFSMADGSDGMAIDNLSIRDVSTPDAGKDTTLYTCLGIIDLNDAQSGEVWSKVSEPTDATASIDASTGMVTGLSVDGEYKFLLTKTGNVTCHDTIRILRSCIEEICNDNIDNDGDGLIDCADGDCYTSCNPCNLGTLLSACVGPDCPLATFAIDDDGDCIEDTALSGYPGGMVCSTNNGLYRPQVAGYPTNLIRGRDAAFNTIIRGDLIITEGAEIEGKVAIGGNLVKNSTGYFGVGESGGGTYVIAPANEKSLIIKGTTIGGNNSFGVGGTGVLIGGNYDATQNTFPNWISVADNVGTTAAVLGIDIDEVHTDLYVKSQYWSSLATTGVGFVGDNSSSLQVFDISSFPANGSFTGIPDGATVLVNVSGTNPSLGRYVTTINTEVLNRASLFTIIWNFYEATTLSLPEFDGAVIAPLADVALVGPSFDGRLYVGGNLEINSPGNEIHNYPFTGSLPCPTTIPEICNNNIDDDGDGLTDCDDPDCQIANIINVSFSNCTFVGNEYQSTLSIEVEWSNPPAGENIIVSANNTTQTIDIVGGTTSPATVQFTITADNSQNNPIAIDYSGGGGCPFNTTYNAPAPCPIPTDRNIPCDNSSGHVGGIVFEDLSGDGVQDNGEPGLAGILVSATDSTGATVGQTTTNNIGVFQFETLTNGIKVRLEFTAIPSGMYPTNATTHKGTTVQFEQVPSCDATLGLIDPTENDCAAPNNAIIQNGYALVSTLPAGDAVTLSIKDITQLGTLWQTAGNRNTNQAANVNTIQTWTTADFEGASIFSTTINPKDGTIYAVASPLHASAANTETVLFETAIAPKVFKIDAVTGVVTRIAELPGTLGLGYIEFDAIHEQLFITNIDDSRIYRLNTDGTLLSSFDPLTADDGISGQLPTLGDRILGVAFNQINKRVYYSIWSNHYDRTNVSTNVNATFNTIRSVALDANGAFIPASDQLEIAMPYGNSGFNLTTPVGDIAFNRSGDRVLLAEFPLGENTSTNQIVTAAYIGVLREYQLSAGVWNLEPSYGGNDEGKYDIGSQTFYKGRNSRGGVDWGYESVTGTTINGDESYILTTGDALHITAIEGDNIFGLQFMPATGGNITNSILVDLDNNLAAENLYAYGDVDIFKDYCATLSLEIGNYVWVDEDEDGIQDPNEYGMPGVNVTLYNAVGDSLTTVVTDADGGYYFNDVTHGLLPSTTYYLVIGKGGQYNTSLGVLNQVNNLTTVNIGAGNYSDLNDSDGVIATVGNGQPVSIENYPFIEVQTGALGQNDYSFDFGFRQICSAAIVVNDSIVLCPSTSYEGSVAVNDKNYTDKNFSVIVEPTIGTVTMNSDGTFAYTNTTSNCTTDEFIYQVCDETSICCVSAIVHLNFNDTIIPTLTNIPANDTVSCDELIPLPSQIFAIDNCPRIALDVQEESTQGEDGCSLYDYTITRTWTAIDQCGNSTSASQVIEVEDKVAPDIYRIYTLPNGKKLIAGVMELVGEHWKTINLPIDFTTKPIILHQVVTSDAAIPVVSQIQNISVSQFELKIKAEEAHTTKLARKSVAWIALEAGAQTTDYQLDVNSLLVSEVAQAVNFQNAFAATPALFVSSQTTDEADPFTIRQSGLTTTGANLILQEEASDDVELTHTDEKIGYLAIEKLGSLREAKGILIGEVGTVAINSTWTTVNLNHRYHNPVIIANSLSNIDGEAATVSIRNVGLDEFEVSVNEWAYLDGTHNNETVSYIVVEGSIPLESPGYCDNGTDSLDISIDFKSVDNCDVSVVINYVEKDTFIGATKVITRTWSAEDECGNATAYSQEISCEGVSLQIKSVLQGAMLNNNGDGLMRDDLRRKNLLPMKEPYTEIDRFQHVASGGGEAINDISLLAEKGANSIVDWVFVELRDANDVDNVVATKSALIQRNGDVVTVRGDTLLHFTNTRIGEYYVAIRHRNHLGIISLNTYIFLPNAVPMVDFTFNFTPVVGDHSSVEMDNLESLWSGDLNNDGKVIYQGPNNDIFYMFLHVLRDEGNQDFLPNYISRGYTNDDFNLDGTVIYQGPSNDRSRLLFNTILSHPNNSNKFSNFIIYSGN